MRTIFLVMDSLNRHYLHAYGDDRVKTPNLDRLAARSVVFDNHWSGSMPCMPARREMMTGRINFLEAPWGPIEPWDDCLPTILRQNKIYSHMITDHYHYFHSGGEVYNTLFDSYEFERGQEGDKWKPGVAEPKIPKGRGKGMMRRAYWANRAEMDSEDDLNFPTPRCFQRAIEFIEKNHNQDNWHLHLEVFDPHEPFDSPQRYRDMYHDKWNRYHYNWPEYSALDNELDDSDAVAHIRNCYAATLTMTDVWLGSFLDSLDKNNLWDDVVLILTSDHGHLLGEHGYWAKNYTMDFAELAHIPLMICAPGLEAGTRRTGLTATMDIMPTILDLHSMQIPDKIHGRSLKPLFTEDCPHHNAVLFGHFGKDVNLTDGRYTYCRQPREGSIVHQHTAMPRGFADFLPRKKLASAELGVFLSTAQGIPHYRISITSFLHHNASDENPVFDLQKDPLQLNPLHDRIIEDRLIQMMIEQLRRCEAPPCQYERLGLTNMDT